MLVYLSFALLVLNGISAQRRAYPSPSTFRPFGDPTAAPARFGGGQDRGQDASDILEQISEINPDGSFRSKFATADGITFEEVGQPKNLGNEVVEDVQGSASWTSKEGQPISISWHADENGAVFQGDHLPTAPPVPLLIQRALDFIAANPPKNAQEGAYVADADQIGPLKPSPFQGFTSTRRPAGRGF